MSVVSRQESGSAAGSPRLAVQVLSAALVALFAAVPGLTMPVNASSTDILQALLGFRELGSVLYIAAHPDDENTRLLTYFARGRGLRTAYLSLTRGDGGQNLIGPELREALGVIRTHELLAARKIDGARQYFTRAVDFGYSKDFRETFSIWDRQAVLTDVVRVMRLFRPDVVIARFPAEPSETHGHHTASGILALEGFHLAGDPRAFPETLSSLPPWQPRRMFLNVRSLAPSSRRPPPDVRRARPSSGLLQLDIGRFLPLQGESTGELAARSRSMHKSQGMGSAGTRGVTTETFEFLAGEPAETDLLEGIDTSWGRLPGGAPIGQMTESVIAAFDPLNAAASVPALLELRTRLDALAASLDDGDASASDLLEEKRRELDRILQACLALHVETIMPAAEVVAGETLALRHEVIARSSVPVRWLETRVPGRLSSPEGSLLLPPNRTVSRDVEATLSSSTPLSHPYWLREKGTVGMHEVGDTAMVGLPVNSSVFPIQHVFEVGGHTLVVEDEPVEVIVDPVRGELRRTIEVIPPVSLAFDTELELFGPGTRREVVLEATAARTSVTGTLELRCPPGWSVSPASHPFNLEAPGDTERFAFTVEAPATPDTTELAAIARVGGAEHRSRRVQIRYDHIPTLLLQPPARLKVISLELAIRGKNVGYLPGAGDAVAESLERMGYTVTFLTGADLDSAGLKGLDTVVIGPRAFNTRFDLATNLSGLFAWVEAGGTAIVQYNTSRGLLAPRLAPYPLELSRDRVTDERAPVTLLTPDHAVFTTPNEIGSEDFEGWVQERGLYFAGTWDDRFTPLLELADGGEPPRRGSLLVARHGKGHYVYTGLAWFRQLPQGVPGAYRIFANLVSLGR